MKYFIDTEFIAGFHKPLLSKKRRHFIDLISIGIYAEDERELYAISSEYNYNDADSWVKQNVIAPMYRNTVHNLHLNAVSVSTFQKIYGWSNKEIAQQIIDFVGDDPVPEFYGYYADYDWVLFCSLFGRMIDLPKGFPMYCHDLKQDLDRLARRVYNYGDLIDTKKWLPTSFAEALAWVKGDKGYPIQIDEHNALEDAKWNAQLYEFLQKHGA